MPLMRALNQGSQQFYIAQLGLEPALPPVIPNQPIVDQVVYSNLECEKIEHESPPVQALWIGSSKVCSGLTLIQALLPKKCNWG